MTRLTFHIGLNARRGNAESWGDLAFAQSLAAAMDGQGCRATLFFRDEVPSVTGQGDVVLRIIGPHLDDPVPDLPNILWMISPPNQASIGQLSRYQQILCASAALTAQSRLMGLEARYLPQATDHRIFHPEARVAAEPEIGISFVGNLAPRAPRRIVLRAIDLGHRVQIWGQGWDGHVPGELIQGTRLSIEELAQVYARSRIVLNSHMPMMASLGFMSNRTYDALACGACVISDRVVGFDGSDLVGLYQVDDDDAGLGDLLVRLLAAPHGPEDRARIEQSLCARHGFEAVAQAIIRHGQDCVARGLTAPPAFRLLPARPKGKSHRRVHLTDTPSDGEPPEFLETQLDAALREASLEVTLALSDPTSSPEDMDDEAAMQRAALSIWRIRAVMARVKSFARLDVIAPQAFERKGVVHAVMPDHRQAQAAILDPAKDGIALLNDVCARVRRLLEAPLPDFSSHAVDEVVLDPVQIKIRQLGNRPLYPHMPADFSRDQQKRHLLLWPRQTAVKPIPSIGVFIHLFYADLAEVFRHRLAHLGMPHDIYISTDTEEKAVRIRAVFPQALVRVVPNRGRDIVGKFVGFSDLYAKHDLVLHLHGKKSLHATGLDAWLAHCLDALVPSAPEVARILSLFQSIPDLGLIAPLTYRRVLSAAHWGDNQDIAQELLLRMGVDGPVPSDWQLDFPVGSMFWARTAALQPVLDLDLQSEHFPAEKGQVDGTLAHAIERMIGVAARAMGFKMIRVAPAGSLQHKGSQIRARSNDEVRQALRSGALGA